MASSSSPPIARPMTATAPQRNTRNRSNLHVCIVAAVAVAISSCLQSCLIDAAKLPTSTPLSRSSFGNNGGYKVASRSRAFGKARRVLQQQSSNQFNACPSGDYILSGPTKDSIFDELTVDEYTSVAEFLAETLNFTIPSTGYTTAAQSTAVGGGASNLTNLNQASDGADSANTADLNYNLTVFDSYLYNVFLYPVNKADALSFLDHGGLPPKRFATAIAVRGGYDPPDVMEYKVGPLPLDGDTVVEQLYEDGEIPYVKRPADDLVEAVALGEWASATLETLKDLFFDFVDQCGSADDPDCDGNNITAFNVIPATREDGTNRMATILHFFSAGEGSSYELHNLPFAYKINATDRDYTLWQAFEFEFCGQGFATIDGLLASYNDNSLKICRPTQWLEPGYTAAWSELGEPSMPRKDGMNRPGPRVYEPSGKRFLLLQGESPTSRVFQWGGWQAHVTTQPWAGLSFHDVRFKGERILYELSLNDLMVAYSGYSTVGQTYYLDGFDQIGASQYTLRPGYDCPETAAYMPLNAMGPFGQQYTFNESVCFFEMTDQTTSWRHFDTYADGSSNVRSVRSYQFVVRAVATLGNYDYIVSVYFYLDGSIKCEVKMAGYMQALYYDTEFNFSERDLMYGTRVQQQVIGNIHDHLSSWKVDLDVVGINNTFHTTSIKVGTYDDVFGPGSTPSWALPTDVMKYQDDRLAEEEAGYVLNYKEPTIFRVVNEDAKNAWGVPKAYGIFPGATSTQLLPDSHPLTKAGAWSKYNVAIAQRKEDEPTSSKDYYDAHSPGEPVYSLDMALDGESIVNEDLVAWVSIGIQHVPRSEDIPLITNIGSDFSIKPVNYFDSLESLDIIDYDDFEACASAQGSALFDYVYSADGDNKAGDKAGFKYSGPLSSSDAFDPTSSLVALNVTHSSQISPSSSMQKLPVGR